MDSLLQEGSMDRGVSFLPAHNKLVEVRSVEQRGFESRDRVDRLCEFPRAAYVLGGPPTEAVRTEPRHVRRRADRQERLIRANIRHRLLAADVLLPGLERHAEGPMPLRVPRQADHAPRHLPDVRLSTREDPEKRATEVHLGAERLAFADDDVGPEVPRRTDDRLGDRVHADDEDTVRHGSDLLELLLESSEEVRVLHVDAADIAPNRGLP